MSAIPDSAARAAAQRLREHEWRPSTVPLSAPLPAVTAEDVIDDPPVGDELQSPSMVERLRSERLTTNALLNLRPPVPLIKGWLYEGTTNIIYGRPKCGKTLITMDLAMSLATGTRWRDIELDQRPVLYLIGEGSAGLGSRARAWAYEHGVDLEREHPIHFVPLSFTLNSVENTAALASLVSDMEDAVRPDGGYRLIVFDTLARYSAGVEENSSAMQTIIDRIDYVRREAAPESAALIIHHTNAAGDKRSRGHSATDGAVDLGLFVSKADDTISAEVVNFRNGPEGETHRWRLITVPEARRSGEDYDPPTVIVDERTETAALPKSRHQVLDDLRAIQVGDEWISSSRWQQATEINERTFHRAKKDLVELGYVETTGSDKSIRYRIPITDNDSDTEVT